MSWEQLSAARLENDHVLMRSIERADRAALLALVFDPEIWRYFVQRIENEQDLDRFLDQAIADSAAGRRIVFAVSDKATARLAGSMAYGNLSEPEKRLEIGWSWLGRDFRGHGVNRWAKFLLLEHAFERLSCARVEFKTDVLNIQARRALRNIGAVEEGTLRSFNFMPDGRRRDAIYYSILAHEWPAVRARLTAPEKIATVAGAAVP